MIVTSDPILIPEFLRGGGGGSHRNIVIQVIIHQIFSLSRDWSDTPLYLGRFVAPPQTM